MDMWEKVVNNATKELRSSTNYEKFLIKANDFCPNEAKIQKELLLWCAENKDLLKAKAIVDQSTILNTEKAQNILKYEGYDDFNLE